MIRGNAGVGEPVGSAAVAAGAGVGRVSAIRPGKRSIIPVTAEDEEDDLEEMVKAFRYCAQKSKLQRLEVTFDASRKVSYSDYELPPLAF